MRLCTRCKREGRREEATCVLQYVSGDEPSFPMIGWHYRGFRIEAYLCHECAEAMREEWRASHDQA